MFNIEHFHIHVWGVESALAKYLQNEWNQHNGRNTICPTSHQEDLDATDVKKTKTTKQTKKKPYGAAP